MEARVGGVAPMGLCAGRVAVLAAGLATGLATGLAGVLAAGLAAGLPAKPAAAAGYGLKEHSAKALGNALAGATAGAEDVTYAVFNPAALARQSGSSVAAVATYVAPSADLEDVQSTAGGPAGASDVASSVVLPSLYAHHAVTDRLHLGFAINAPWGLETSYDQDWAGRYYGTKTRVETLTLAPMAAYSVNEAFQIGGGVFAQRAKGELANAVDFGLLAGVGSGLADGSAAVEGDDWGWGFQLGALYEPVEGTRFGLAYRSKVNHELNGDARFDLGGPVGEAVAASTGGFQNGGFSTSLTTPEQVTFGLHQTLNDRWAVMAEAQWTRWSRFQELRIDFDNPVQPDDVTGANWKNTWFAALGATYRPSSDWTLRAGVAYDQSPTRIETRSPRIPDADRTWLALGVGYTPNDWLSLDFAYSHFWMRESNIDQSSGQNGNAFRGDLSARTDSSADIFSVQAVARF